MLEFLVILIKVIAPCIGVWAVVHYINVHNEKKYPQFYDHDEKWAQNGRMIITK